MRGLQGQTASKRQRFSRCNEADETSNVGLGDDVNNKCRICVQSCSTEHVAQADGIRRYT